MSHRLNIHFLCSIWTSTYLSYSCHRNKKVSFWFQPISTRCSNCCSPGWRNTDTSFFNFFYIIFIRSSKRAGITTSIGFALMFLAAIMILLSLACRIPSVFLVEMIINPTLITISLIIALHLYYEKRTRNKH
jgi:hypothetical protein